MVRTGRPLHGTVRAGGAKNSALKLMAACLLAEGRHVLAGVPRIVDVEIMAEVLAAIGARVARAPTGPTASPATSSSTRRPRSSPRRPTSWWRRCAPRSSCSGRCWPAPGRASVSLPGGDDFGNRPIDIHLHGLSTLGAVFETVHGNIEGRVPAAPTAGSSGTGRLRVPEPHRHRQRPHGGGAGQGDHRHRERGTRARGLRPGRLPHAHGGADPGGGHVAHRGRRRRGAAPRGRSRTVIPDRVVAATLLAAVGLAGGDIVIEDARPDHMDMLLRKLGEMGVTVTQTPEGLRATASGRLHSVDVATLPYPGVATDYKPFLVTMLSVADGVGIVTENLFSGRFRYVDELRRMGADIRTEGHHAVVRGVRRLSGAPVRAPDLRAGAALVLAGLVAEGETVVSDADHIDRGYEDLAGQLSSLGADVTRA